MASWLPAEAYSHEAVVLIFIRCPPSFIRVQTNKSINTENYMLRKHKLFFNFLCGCAAWISGQYIAVWVMLDLDIYTLQLLHDVITDET